MFEKLPPPHPEMDHTHEDHEGHEDQQERRAAVRRRILDRDIAEEIIQFRDREFPLGFRTVKEL
jgi:hypothetical protein